MTFIIFVRVKDDLCFEATFECSYGSDWFENGVRLNSLWPVRRHDFCLVWRSGSPAVAIFNPNTGNRRDVERKVSKTPEKIRPAAARKPGCYRDRPETPNPQLRKIPDRQIHLAEPCLKPTGSIRPLSRGGGRPGTSHSLSRMELNATVGKSRYLTRIARINTNLGRRCWIHKAMCPIPGRTSKSTHSLRGARIQLDLR